MDDYIYILLAIAWIAFTIYSQKQKKKKQQQQAKPQQQTQKDVKSYFEEILLGNVSSPDPILTETEPVIHKEIYESVSGYKTSENIQSEYEFLEEGSQLSEEYFDKNSAIEKPEIQIEKNFEVKTEEDYEGIEYLDFDIRKAVIYSEILKRPYT